MTPNRPWALIHTYLKTYQALSYERLQYDERGLVGADWLARNTPTQEATYYLCGLRPFLRAMVGGLARTGVPLGHIRYEFFGPADELLAP